jgi:hypothetical protein
MAYPTTIDSTLNVTDHVTRIRAADVNVANSAIMAIENLLGAGATLPTANATASTIVKRNSNGDATFAYVNATSGVQVAKSTQAASVFAVDAANLGSGFTLADTAIAYPFGLSNNFCGIFLVKETATDGHTAFLLNAGHTIIMLGESSGGTVFSTTASTASRINIYTHGSLFCPAIENKRGGSRTFHVVGFRLASSS